MTHQDFEQLVQRAAQEIPPEFRRFLADIAVVVEDEPTVARKRGVRVPKDEELFGLYEGTPHTERQYLPHRLPDKITIFQRPLERFCGSDRDCLRAEVAHTVWHELAHALGMDEHHVRRAEHKRRRRART